MNDPQIRHAFHTVFLSKEHNDPSTLVLDELGLEHGKCIADIAVINAHLEGYEIKSDVDSLYRLNQQIDGYDAIFDHSSIIVTACHIVEASKMVPEWWGIISASESIDNIPQFEIIRRPCKNPKINNYAVAQLLWREEAQKVLLNNGIRGAQLRQKRSFLYGYIAETLDSNELRFTVREYLKERRGWRRPGQQILCDD